MGGPFPPGVARRVRGPVMVGGDCGAESRRVHVGSMPFFAAVGYARLNKKSESVIKQFFFFKLYCILF